MPLISCRLLFSSTIKWTNWAIVPSGHWALNTMTSVIQWGKRCSYADHMCYLDDDWCCYAQTGPGYMTNHKILAYKTLLPATLYLFWGCCFGDGCSTFLVYNCLELYGANAQNTYRHIHNSYCSQPILTKWSYWAVFLERIESSTLKSHESLVCLACEVYQCLSWKTYTCWKKQNLKSETKLHILYAIYWTTLLPWDLRTNL